MPRKNRRESATGVYHVIARGNNKEMIFEKDSDKIKFLDILGDALKDYPIKLYAYCIMSNHMHLMLESDFAVLPRFMQRVNSTFAEHFNSRYDRSGHVFQGRYYSDCVETEDYYWCCLRYIHNNPVKACMVTEPHRYEFGSAKEYFEGQLKLLEENAFKMLRTRFQNMDEFWQFHRLFEQKSFLDTVEDEQIYNSDRIRIMVEQHMFQNGIEEVETLLTVGRIKKKFFESCKKETGLSERKIENILKMDRKRV